MSESHSKEVETIADPWGIVTQFRDNFDVLRQTTAETRRAILAAMGLSSDDSPADTPPAVRVVPEGETAVIDAPAELRLEDGACLRIAGALPPDLPLGYHQLQPLDGRAPILVVRCPAAAFFGLKNQIWGWAVQLYAARSRKSWGIGDFGDLRRLGGWARGLGAEMLLLNPLSAIAPVLPQEASPYFPSSRRFRNPLYLCIEDIPGAAEAGVDLERLSALGRQLNDQRRIDRDAVFQLKMEALEQLWSLRRDDRDFDTYRGELGEGLAQFGCFCALSEEFREADWRKWPEEYRRPASPQVVRFARDRETRIGFHMWLQWLLDGQLAAAARQIALVADLPVGVDPGGADAWEWQDVLTQGASAGTPPDPFNTPGQDWGVAPFVPHRLRATGYKAFIETIRASLRHAGGLRIDHVMALFRLYWVPKGFTPPHGAYVLYPSEELLGIVALESHRAGAWVAGEDLGTVEPAVRRRLNQLHLLSSRLLWFEDERPPDYKREAIVSVSTHDLPTVAGLWSGSDLQEMASWGLRPDEKFCRQMRDRLIAATGVQDDVSVEEVVLAAHRALGAAPSAVLVASLDDALAVKERPNMPCTPKERPNWSLALPQPLEDIESRALPKQIAAALGRQRAATARG